MFEYRAGETVSRGSLAAAAIYVGSAAWMLWFGFRDSPRLIVWLAAVATSALAAYAATAWRAGRGGGRASAGGTGSPPRESAAP